MAACVLLVHLQLHLVSAAVESYAHSTRSLSTDPFVAQCHVTEVIKVLMFSVDCRFNMHAVAAATPPCHDQQTCHPTLGYASEFANCAMQALVFRSAFDPKAPTS